MGFSLMTKEQCEKKEIRRERALAAAGIDNKIFRKPNRPKRSSTKKFKPGFFTEQTDSSSGGVLKLDNTTAQYSPIVENVEDLFKHPSVNNNIISVDTKVKQIQRKEDKESKQLLRSSINEQIDEEGYFIDPEMRWKYGSWVNCDLRYFDFRALGSDFDVVLLDPPWRLRGSEPLFIQRSMFTNNKFSLNYNTLSNEEISDLDVESLSKSGLIFLWVINSQMQLGLECMKLWGYSYVNRIIWVKKTKNDKIVKNQGYYFLHSSEVCLIGAKGKHLDSSLVSINRVSNDVLFSEIRQKSRKQIELFARNHNIRPEWLSLGNQLGKYYDCDRDTIFCDHCKKEIVPGMRRYKSRSTKNLDFCYDCISKTSEDVQNFILLENNAEEMVFHEYFECNICKANPIPGIRFTCSICPSFDLCESCYDTSILIDSQIHKVVHNFDAFEIPELAGGLPIHVLKCQGCNTFPIVGYCFTCTICKQMQLCQNVSFLKRIQKR